MGFTPKQTVYRLDFEDTDLDGLEVRIRGGKLAQAFTSAGLVGITESNATAADVQLMLSQYQDLANHIVEWNLDDEDGNPVVADLGGLQTLELRYVKMIADAWQRAQVDVPGPLPQPSTSGRLPDVLSVPMAPIPESLAS